MSEQERLKPLPLIYGPDDEQVGQVRVTDDGRLEIMFDPPVRHGQFGIGPVMQITETEKEGEAELISKMIILGFKAMPMQFPNNGESND